jgi:RNA polymerase sigma factor (sigma-70 family)
MVFDASLDRRESGVASVEQVRDLREPMVRARSLEDLYDLHAPGLRRRCRQLTGDADAAEDLAQEVFVRFMARFPEPPAGMNVAGYLHATARNILWKQLRDHREVADGEIERSVGSDEDLEVDPERSILLVEQRHLVRRCSAVLTGRQRRALVLREIEGHSYAEIGSDLGVGTDAVAKIISRARARLRVIVRRAHVDLDRLSPECRAMLGPLSDYLDGHAASSPDIEQHLAVCESCRSTLAAFRGAGSRLRGTLPFAPLLARIGEAVRLGGGAPVDAVRAGAVGVAAALAIGGGGILVAHEATARSHARPATVRAHVPEAFAASAQLAPAPPAEPTSWRPGAGPLVVQGRRVSDVTGQHGRRHPGRPVSPKNTPTSHPAAVVTAPARSPGAAPSVTPATQPAETPATSKPDTVPQPPAAGGTDPPAATTPVDPARTVTPTVDRVVTPVVTTVVTPVVDTVVTPVVEKVVDPVVTKVVVPVTAPVTNAVEPVTAPVVNAVTPVTTPVTQAVAPVVDPVSKAVAPATDPVTSVVGSLLPSPTAP